MPRLSEHSSYGKCRPAATGLVLQIPANRDEARDATYAHPEERLVEQKRNDIRVEIMEYIESGYERVQMRRHEIDYRNGDDKARGGGERAGEGAFDDVRSAHETIRSAYDPHDAYLFAVR